MGPINHWIKYGWFWCWISWSLMACSPKNSWAPKRHVVATQLPELPASVIQVPIELPTLQLQRLVERALPKPLLEAKTKKFVLHLAPKKAKEDQNWLQRTASPLLQWLDKTVDASAQFAYRVQLHDWTLHFKGQHATIDLWLDLDGTLHLDNALNWEGQRHAIQQTLACPTQVRLTLNGALTLTEEATIDLQLDEKQGGKLEVTRFCSDHPLQAIDLPELLRPTLEPIQKDLTYAINRALTHQLQHLLDSDATRTQLNFQHYLDQAAEYLAQPYTIQDSLWFVPNAQHLVASPPQGIGDGLANRLQLAVGILAHPTLVLQHKAPKVPPLRTKGFVQMPYQPQATVYLKGRWSLEHAAQQVQQYTNAYLQEHYAEYGYSVGKVEIYPQDSMAVMGIQVLRQATGKQKAQLYLKGVPRYDAQQREVYLSDLHFAAESKDVLIHLAKWWRQAELMRRLEQSTRWDAAPYFKQAQEQLLYWQVEQAGNRLEGAFKDLHVEQLWISEQYFEVALRANGRLRATIDWEQW